MANIEQELLAFKNAKKGEDVRDSMISAIRKINTVNEEGVEEIEQKSDQMVEIVDSQIQIDEEPTQYTKLKLETTGTDIEVLTAEELDEYLPETETIGDLKNDIETDRNLLDYTVTESINKWNPETVLENTNIRNNQSYKYGETVSENGYYTSDYIEVNGGDTVSWYYNNNASATFVVKNNMFRLAEYDVDKNVIAVSANWASSPFTTNTNTRYVRVVLYLRQALNMVVLNTTESQIHYVPYSKTIDFNRISEIESDISQIESNISQIETELENPVEVILPSAIYGVTGQEINIYKENLVLNNRLKSVSYIHTKLSNDAVQDDERTIWNPSTQTLAETNREWEVFKKDLINVETKTIKECVVPKDTGSSTIKVLIIGDSKVDNGWPSYHFLHNFDDDNMSCKLLGSKYDWSTDNRNEGWGGKTAQWFCTNASSPLSNNGVCDFAHYLSTYSIDTPDYVFINLGTNDVNLSASGYDTNFVTYITQMINSIHSVSSNINVIVGLCEGVATVKDTNNAIFINWDMNEKISKLHKATITAFDNRQNEHIYVCPMYMGMDLRNDYNMTEVPLSARDGDANGGTGNGKTRMQITDHVHQNEVGYWKNADYMYAIVKYIVAKNQ